MSMLEGAGMAAAAASPERWAAHWRPASTADWVPGTATGSPGGIDIARHPLPERPSMFCAQVDLMLQAVQAGADSAFSPAT